MTNSIPSPKKERRHAPRHAINLEVDYASGNTFLYAYVANVSALGIFVCTPELKPVGTMLKLGFTPSQMDQKNQQAAPKRIELEGEVMWTTTNHATTGQPGMGVRFLNVDEQTKKQLLELVRAIAYLEDTGK